NESSYLNNGIGDFGTGNNGVRAHHAVGVLLADLGNQERTHTGTGSSTKRMGDLEA
ncbi:hypothetical protein C0991_004850, partial [Blastosporella zonata]